jgi:beta-hydroxylase
MLEAKYSEILNELQDLKTNNFVPWKEKFLYNQGWDIFGLYYEGFKLRGNCFKCPNTTRIVEEIPGLRTAGFSRMAPGTIIKPHVGYTSKVLRCHLGLVTPVECGLRVGSKQYNWDVGKAFVFDDTIEHEAWNHSDKERIILLIDFLK